MRIRRPDFAEAHLEPFSGRLPVYLPRSLYPPPARFWSDLDRINSELRLERMYRYRHCSTEREDFLQVLSGGLRKWLRPAAARRGELAWKWSKELPYPESATRRSWYKEQCTILAAGSHSVLHRLGPPKHPSIARNYGVKLHRSQAQPLRRGILFGAIPETPVYSITLRGHANNVSRPDPLGDDEKLSSLAMAARAILRRRNVPLLLQLSPDLLLRFSAF